MINRDIYLNAQDISYTITALNEYAYRIVQDLAHNYKGPIDQADPETQKKAERANRCAEITSKLIELLADNDPAVVHIERVTP